MSRTWVFQERLLSSRTVFFARNQLFWECGELYASEVFPRGGPWDKKYDRLDLKAEYYFFRKNERIQDRYAKLRATAGNYGEYLTCVVQHRGGL